MTLELREIFRMPGSMNGPNEFISQVVSWVDDLEAVIAKQLHGEGLFFLLVVCFGSKCQFIFYFFCVCLFSLLRFGLRIKGLDALFCNGLQLGHGLYHG